MKEDGSGAARRVRMSGKAANHRKILDAAMQIFIGSGYAKADLTQVADLAGVATGTIYLHFVDKAGLFERLIDDWIEAHAARLDSRPAGRSYSDEGDFKAAAGLWLRSQEESGWIKVWLLLLSRSFALPDLVGKFSERVVLPWAGAARLPERAGHCTDGRLVWVAQIQLLSLALAGAAGLLSHPTDPHIAALTEAMLDQVWSASQPDKS